MTYDPGRYAVIRHADSKGYWYRVIDKQVHRDNLKGDNTVAVYRSRKSAHRRCDELNKRLETLSGSEWAHREGLAIHEPLVRDPESWQAVAREGRRAG